jgi:hypothetical protein
MNPTPKKLVSDASPIGKRDLYAAFIQRCYEFAGQHGRVGILTMHSFMFISAYENLRSYLRERVRIDALANLRAGQRDPVVYRYRQGDFDAIAGSPWVYHLPTLVLKLLHDCRLLADVASPSAGMHGGDRFRCVRYWWEVGLKSIGKSWNGEKDFLVLKMVSLCERRCFS